MPYNARQMTKKVKFGESPVSTVIDEKYRTQKMSGRLRPNLSARAPKNNAPTGRIASVRVSVYTTDTFDTWKWFASASKRNTRTKKSNESSTQPRIPEVTATFQPFTSCPTSASDPVASAMFRSTVSAGVSRFIAVNSTACEVRTIVSGPGAGQNW